MYIFDKVIFLHGHQLKQLSFLHGQKRIKSLSGHGAGGYLIHAPDIRTGDVCPSEANERKRERERYRTLSLKNPPDFSANERAGRGRDRPNDVAKEFSRSYYIVK